MAGWSKLEDNPCVQQCNETLKNKELKIQSNFVELVSRFLKGSFGSDFFRPLPPRLGNGHCVDLLQLYFVVKNNGGFEAISEKNFWGEVGLQCGLGSNFGSALKLIYAKYLSSLDSWLVNLDKEKDMGSNWFMELERDYRAYESKIMDVKSVSDGSCSFHLAKSGITLINLKDEDKEDENENENENEIKKQGWKKLVMEFADSVKSKHKSMKVCFEDVGDSTEGNAESIDLKQENIVRDYSSDGLLEENYGCENLKQVMKETSSIDGISTDRSDNKRFSASPVVADDVIENSEISVASKTCSIKDDDAEIMSVDSGMSKKVSNRKRKQDCFSGMLRWMANVAKDPNDPVIGEIPESSRWVSYGNENSWKQALLAREALFFKKIRVHRPDQFGCQKKQKMHSSSFGDSQNLSTSTPYKIELNPPRLGQRLSVRLDMQPTASIYTCRSQQRIPVGKPYQAELPEWTGVAIESDPKWLGTKTWPLDKTEKRAFFERDPLGKGRIDNCGCQFFGSTECVKFHVSQKRMKTKLELGSAFYAWNFDKMGEDCSVSWTSEEEKIFTGVILENPKSSGKRFWEPMRTALPQKRWKDLVNYYYNVFMLRLRGYQNRDCPTDIDSDDDETYYQPTNKSLKRRTS